MRKASVARLRVRWYSAWSADLVWISPDRPWHGRREAVTAKAYRVVTAAVLLQAAALAADLQAHAAHTNADIWHAGIVVSELVALLAVVFCVADRALGELPLVARRFEPRERGPNAKPQATEVLSWNDSVYGTNLLPDGALARYLSRVRHRDRRPVFFSHTHVVRQSHRGRARTQCRGSTP